MNEDRTLTTPNTDRTPGSTIESIFAELWRYKLVVPAVALLVIGAVAFWTVRQPKIYEATATLEYDPSPAQPLGSAVEDTSRTHDAFWDTQEFYETQNFILRSRSIAERVVKKLGLQRDKEFLRARDVDVPADEAALALATNILQNLVVVEQVRDTRVVRVRVRDRSPDRAQLIANTMVESYIEKSLEDRLGTTGRAVEWLGQQMQNLKRDLEASELALYRFREEHHTLSASLEERRKIIAGQLQSYSGALTDVHARRVQIEARLSVLREVLASTDDLMALHAGPFAANPTVEGLRMRYREARERLETLSITYGSEHPQVRAARAASDAVLKQLQTQVQAIMAGVEAEVREFERAEGGIQAALEAVNRQGLQLSLQEIDYTRLDRERNSKVTLYDTVMERAAQADLTRALRVANARMVDSAIRPAVPVSPRIRIIAALGGIGALLLGVIAALGVSYLDNKVRGPADIEARKVTVLGVLPAIASGGSSASSKSGRERTRRSKRNENPARDLVVHLEPRSTVAECCRTIRTNITFQSADRELRTIVVTSAMPRDGKTTVAVSVATVLCQSGRRVLLVDTDLRKPRLHRVFGSPSTTGITSILAGEASLDEVVRTSDIPGLTLLPCGPLPPNPSELLHTRRFAEIIQEMRSKYDTVIFDSPPLGAVTDPAIIATQMDGTIVVVRSGSTTRAGVDAALRQLYGVSAPIIGVVLNGVDLTDSDYGSYYAYYRGYYEDDDRSSTPPNAAKSSA